MESFFSALMNPGAWNQTQWLAVSIGLFVLVAALFFAYRLLQIIRHAGKSDYKPNIGLARARKATGGARITQEQDAGGQRRDADDEQEDKPGR